MRPSYDPVARNSPEGLHVMLKVAVELLWPAAASLRLLLPLLLPGLFKLFTILQSLTRQISIELSADPAARNSPVGLQARFSVSVRVVVQDQVVVFQIYLESDMEYQSLELII